MDQNIKHRLVGIAVIFALAVIFLPMILDGSGVEKNTLKVEIPGQPVLESQDNFDQKIIELQTKVEQMPELEARFVDELTTEPENRIQRQVDKKQAVAPEKPKPESTVVAEEPKPPIGGESWVLQVGSFKDRNTALLQRDKLRKANIWAVFIEQFSSNN